MSVQFLFVILMAQRPHPGRSNTDCRVASTCTGGGPSSIKPSSDAPMAAQFMLNTSSVPLFSNFLVRTYHRACALFRPNRVQCEARRIAPGLRLTCILGLAAVAMTPTLSLAQGGVMGYYIDLKQGVFPSKQAVCSAFGTSYGAGRPYENRTFGTVDAETGLCRVEWTTWQTPPQTLPLSTHQISYCGLDSNNEQHKFMDGKCVLILPSAPPKPEKPSDNGPPCCDGGATPPPHVGKPIHPGTGNMWHQEVDYQGVAANTLALVRTYNSSPYLSDADKPSGLGSRWAQPAQSVLRQELPEAKGEGKCWIRTDTMYIWCESSPVPFMKPIPDAISISLGDGKKYVFKRGDAGWTSGPDVNGRVTAVYDATKTAIVAWKYAHATGDRLDTFSATGLLMSVTERDGTSRYFTYSDGVTNDTRAGRMPADAPPCSNVQTGLVHPAGRLLCVTDHWGRRLQYEYSAAGRITKVIDPAGQAISYDYDGPSGGCAQYSPDNRACSANNLTKVTYQNGSSREYFYNEAAMINGGLACPESVQVGSGFANLLNAMTGVVDENGDRHLSWTYDCKGLATSSFVGEGMEKVVLSYGEFVPGAGASGGATNKVSHYVGEPAAPTLVSTDWRYEVRNGSPKLVGIDKPCRECGASQAIEYDANGNGISRQDWNGNRTASTFDLSRNLQTSRTEAVGTAQARTITTQWHPLFRLPVKVAEPKRITTYTHDARGNVLTVSKQASTDATGSAGFAAVKVGVPQVSTYTYTASGQVATVTGPRTDLVDIVRYAYDEKGNLKTITDALKRDTVFSNYDEHGRARTIQAPTGAVTTLTYGLRGQLDVKVVSAGGIDATTKYEYDPAGQLKKVVFPDASFSSYTYDSAQRLTGIVDGLGNSIRYTLDLSGNRVLEDVLDRNGVLTRQIARTYDTMDRMTSQSGASD
jgi:YD repeat-containing protein